MYFFRFAVDEAGQGCARGEAVHYVDESDILRAFRRRRRSVQDQADFGEVALFWRQTDPGLFRRRGYFAGRGRKT